MISILQLKGGSTLSADVNTLKNNRYREFIDKFTTTNEQTVFTLTNVPTDTPITLEINGICYYETTDFTVNRETSTVTWTNEDITIQEGWNVVIRYGILSNNGSLPVAGGGSGSTVSYDDTALLQRISALQNRVTSLENSTIPAAYDDTALSARVSVLENRTDSDTVYDDTDIKNQIDAMQSSIESLESQVSSVLTRLATLEGYFTDGKANSAAAATVAYSIPIERKTTDTDTQKAIWYEE